MAIFGHIKQQTSSDKLGLSQSCPELCPEDGTLMASCIQQEMSQQTVKEHYKCLNS